MKDYNSKDVRNIVLCGHSGSGKSTFIEGILFNQKRVDRMGKAADGTLAMDFEDEEKKRGLSVYTSLAPIEWKDTKINFLDTPGYLDYEGEMVAAASAADGMLIMIGAKDGVQTGTEKAWKLANEKHLPVAFFINKMDEDNANFEAVYEDLRNKFSKNIVAFEMPVIEGGKNVGVVNVYKKKAFYYDGSEKEVPADMADTVSEHYDQIVEAIASTDDELMMKFFDGEEFTEEEVIKGIKTGIHSGEIRPVYCGSGLKHQGSEGILKTIRNYFPAYCENGTVEASYKGEPVTVRIDESEPFSALVFKTVVDPFVGRISYIKVVSGDLTTSTPVLNVQEGKMEKFNQVITMCGKQQIQLNKLAAGDIGALTKLQVTETNETLAAASRPVELPKIVFPEPMLGVAIEPASKNDEDKLSGGLSKILEEDQTIRIDKNAETHQTVLYGVGDQHIDVIVNRLKNKYKVEVKLTEPKTQYRETIRGKVEVQGKHKKQSGGAGQYGDVWIRFEPCDSDEMVFAEEVFGGAVPKQYFPPVEAGLRECMERGVLAGYKVVGVKATLYDGSYHPVDSKEIAFKAAARKAYKAGMPKAKPVLLEPIGKAEIIVPEEYTGTIYGDITKRRGMIMGMDATADGDQKIEAEVPMSEMLKYATELRSMTQGKGSYSLKFDRYEAAPEEVSKKVIAAAAKDMVDDDED